MEECNAISGCVLTQVVVFLQGLPMCNVGSLSHGDVNICKRV